MSQEGLDHLLFRPHTAYLLDLHLLNHIDEVLAVTLDQREEAAMRGGTVGARELKVVGNFTQA